MIAGGGGQLGTVLCQALNEKYGSENVLVTDVKELHLADNPFELLNVVDFKQIQDLLKKHSITKVFHLAAILSAKGEENPGLTRKVNSDGYFNMLCAAVDSDVKQIFYPSSIAVFGPDLAKNVEQNVVCCPTTVYGVTKVNCENWSQYFTQRYGLDIRSIRYPGVIGYQSMPGGGTTDYAVTIFHSAMKGEKFQCFIAEDEKMPMIYMPDAIRATLELMDADIENIHTRTSYNVSGLSFSPAEIAQEIRKHIPSFEIEYVPDDRQTIAASWPDSVYDKEAQQDWNWKPEYDLSRLVEDMIKHLSSQYK